MSPLKECCGKYKYTQNELLAFVNLTIKQTNKKKNICMNLHKICKVLKSTVMVSLAVQPCCVYRDIIIKWGALNPIRSLLVHNMGW